jgi:hypothetical protein
MKWSAVLMFFACIFLTSDGFSLNSHIYLKSNDIVPDTSSNLVKFDKNLVKINSNKIINNNEIDNKSERNEDENKSTEEDSDELYYYDEDGNGDDQDEVVDEEDDNDKDNEDRAEDEVDDNKDKNEDNMSEYVYDYFKKKDINSEENNERQLMRVTRGHVFESSEDRTELIPRYNDTNNNNNNNDTGRDNQRAYSYNKVKYQDNNNEDDRSDSDDDSERNTHDEDWPVLEDDNGARAVADYVVDYVQSTSNHEKDGNSRCLFGWRLDVNGVCAPRRRECEQGLVRNEEGNCVGPDAGYWYK